MPEFLLLSSSVVVALIGVALACRKDRASRAAFIRGDIDTLYRLCLRDTRRQGRNVLPTSDTVHSSLAKRLSSLPIENLILFGENAFASDHPFAPELFAAVYERLDHLRTAAKLDKDRRFAWPVLRDSFSP